MDDSLNQENSTWSVSELTRHIRDLFENDYILQNIWVFGEVSNVSIPSSGHLYFTMKDRFSTLRCVMWRNQVIHLPYIPREGDSVKIRGCVNVYEAGGQYQFYATELYSTGEGTLYKEFLKIKEDLAKEGLFDQSNKKMIPKWPVRIGVITSPSGAALRDILNTINRRYPLAELILSPSPVQGEKAPLILRESIETINRLAKPDVIILARGGGSIEDLWAFNSEIVARAIYKSNAPIICGVGHETDFTIADFVCDLRAPTPTAAAELATPNIMDLSFRLGDLKSSLATVIKLILIQNYQVLQTTYERLLYQSPQSKIWSEIQKVDILSQKLGIRFNQLVDHKQSQYELLNHKINTLNPKNILMHGYAMILKPNGEIIRSRRQVDYDDELIIKFYDGKIIVTVQDIYSR